MSTPQPAQILKPAAPQNAQYASPRTQARNNFFLPLPPLALPKTLCEI